MTKKKCKKGYNCKNACIEKIDDCDSKLEKEALQVARKYADAVLAISSVGKQSQKLTKEEAEIIDKRASELDEKNIKKLQDDAFAMGSAVSPKILDLTWSMLPSELRGKISRSGNPGKGSWYNPETNEADGAGASQDRGKTILQMYFKQGGVDAYTLDKKKPLNILDMDVEHIVPLGKGGKDHPDNWVMIKSNVNRNRGNKDLSDWAKNALASQAKNAAKKKPEGGRNAALKKEIMALKDEEITLNKVTKTTGKGQDYLARRIFGASSWMRNAPHGGSSRGGVTIPADVLKSFNTAYTTHSSIPEVKDAYRAVVDLRQQYTERKITGADWKKKTNEAMSKVLPADSPTMKDPDKLFTKELERNGEGIIP